MIKKIIFLFQIFLIYFLSINISFADLQTNLINKINDNETVNGEKDELYFKALDIIKLEKKASTSLLQRKLQIGYNRAARIIEMMEKEGIVSQANHVGKREIL